MPKSPQPPSDRTQAPRRSSRRKLSRREKLMLIEIAVGHLKCDQFHSCTQWHIKFHEVESPQECPICLAAQQIYGILRSLSVLPLDSDARQANLDTCISEILNKHVGRPVRGSSAARKKSSTVDIKDEDFFYTDMNTRWAWLLEYATTPDELKELARYNKRHEALVKKHSTKQGS